MGNFLQYLGHKGVEKQHFLRMIAGFSFTPDGGAVYLGDEDIRRFLLIKEMLIQYFKNMPCFLT